MLNSHNLAYLSCVNGIFIRLQELVSMDVDVNFVTLLGSFRSGETNKILVDNGANVSRSDAALCLMETA